MKLINIKRLINLYIKLSNDPIGKLLTKTEKDKTSLKVSSDFKVDELNLISQLLISNNLAIVSKEIDSTIINNEKFETSISFFSNFLIHQRASQWYALRHPNEKLFNENLSSYYKSKSYERKFSDLFKTTFLLPPELSFTAPITQILQNHKSHRPAIYEINLTSDGFARNALILNRIISLILDNGINSAAKFIVKMISPEIELSQFQKFLLLLYLILSSETSSNVINSKDAKLSPLGFSMSKQYFRYFQLKALLNTSTFYDKWTEQSKVFRNTNKELIIAYRFRSNQTTPQDLKVIKSHLKRLRLSKEDKKSRPNYQVNLYLTILYCKKKLQKNEMCIFPKKKKNAHFNNLDYRDLIFRTALTELTMLTYSTPQKKLSLSKLHKKLKNSKNIHLAVSKERELIPYEELLLILNNHIIHI